MTNRQKSPANEPAPSGLSGLTNVSVKILDSPKSPLGNQVFLQIHRFLSTSAEPGLKNQKIISQLTVNLAENKPRVTLTIGD